MIILRACTDTTFNESRKSDCFNVSDMNMAYCIFTFKKTTKAEHLILKSLFVKIVNFVRPGRRSLKICG